MLEVWRVFQALFSLFFSGTAAGSLCLPFLINTLVKTYAFSGTLLVLGGCMLHISISATLYRPLAIHALISKQNRNIVQLHEATHENLQVQHQNLTTASTTTNLASYHNGIFFTSLCPLINHILLSSEITSPTESFWTQGNIRHFAVVKTLFSANKFI